MASPEEGSAEFHGIEDAQPAEYDRSFNTAHLAVVEDCTDVVILCKLAFR
jgi:hypothetical protein